MKKFFKDLLGIGKAIGIIFLVSALIGILCWATYAGFMVGYHLVTNIVRLF